MKLRMTIEVELEQELTRALTDDEGFLEYFEKEVVTGDGLEKLILHSNEIGDTVGIVTKVLNIDYIMHEIKP